MYVLLPLLFLLSPLLLFLLSPLLPPLPPHLLLFPPYFLLSQVMRNLHVVFTMNPSSEGLKDRAATSPALFNR